MGIGFSSVMGTRRRIRMRDDSPDKQANDGGNSKEYFDPWVQMAKESDEERAKRIAHEKKRKEEREFSSKWENQSLFDKRRHLARELVSFGQCSGGDGFFGLYHVGESKERTINEAEGRLTFGNGYRDIKTIQKVARKNSDNERLQQEAEKLISRIREVDEHQGMNPKEYLATKRQVVLDAYKQNKKH